MAERPTSDSAAEQALKKLADQLTCGICLEAYTDPKLLQCFHVFCNKCLEQIAARGQQGQPLICPNCRKTTQKPPNGISGLQGAFHIHHLFEIQDALEKIKAPQRMKCEKCKKQNTTSYCRDCGQFICEVCTMVHETWDEFSSHEVIGLDQLEGDVTKLVPPKKTTMYCSKHKGKELELYCKKCGVLICHNCTIQLHEGHGYDVVSDTFEKHKSEFVSHLQPIKQHLVTVNQAIEGLDVRCHQITDQRTATEANIHKTIRQLHEALEVRKTELISQLDGITQQKLKNLAAQRDQFELVQTQLSSCLDFVSESLRTGSEGEILAMKKPVVKQIKEVTAEFRPDTLVPGELADIWFTSSAEVGAACQQFGKVYTFPVSPEKCYATGKGVEVATVGEETTATLHVVDQEGRECDKLIPHVSCELIFCSDATTVKGSVKRTDKNEYEIRYKPTTRGRHQLHVRVEGEHIKESPFTVTVRLPIAELGTPIRSIGLRFPWGVAVNENGQIIVAECGGHCISIFGRDGEKIKTFGTQGSGRGQFYYPHGVAIDKDGNILVTDGQNHRIQKFTADGQFITPVGTKGNGCLQFGGGIYIYDGPEGIGISERNRIYVCDYSNHRVQILNADLTFNSSFGSKGSDNGQFNNPWGVAFDSTGNVYIADCENHRIQVFTEDGHFLRRFGKFGRGEGDGELNLPTSVTIDSDDIVYVCERDNHRVSLFTSEGRFLRSFGTRGTEPGQFNDPYGITVDRNGLVYVCDYYNSRVQIY